MNTQPVPPGMHYAVVLLELPPRSAFFSSIEKVVECLIELDIALDCQAARPRARRRRRSRVADSFEGRRRMKLRPLGKMVLVERAEAKKESPGGIVLIADDRRAPKQGKVLAVAEGIGLAVGCVVLYDRHAPTVDAGDGGELVPFDHLLAVLS